MATQLLQKRAHNTSGWGAWTSISGADYIGQLNGGVGYVVYKANIDGSTSSVSVSTNFAAYTYNYYGQPYNKTDLTCYLYTYDPTGYSSPPSTQYSSSATVNLYDYGVYQTFSFSGSFSGTVYFWFSAYIYPSDNGTTYRDWLYSYATGNGITKTPSISTSGGGGGGGDIPPIMQWPIYIGHDDGIRDVSVEGINYFSHAYDENGYHYKAYQANIGNTITLNATLNDGYFFDQWYSQRYVAVGGNTVIVESPFSTDNPVSLTHSEYRSDFIAKSIKGSLVSLTAGDYVMVCTGGGTYKTGDSVTVTAILDVPWDDSTEIIFLGWFKDGESDPISTDISYTFIASEDIHLTAKAQSQNILTGFVFIYDNTTKKWNKYIPYIYSNGWKRAVPYIYNNGWKKTL